LLAAIKPLVDAPTHAALVRSAASDAEAIAKVFSSATDVSGLKAERNILRYRKANTTLRIGNDATDFEINRLLLAAAVSRSAISAAKLAPSVLAELSKLGCSVSIESTENWLENLRSRGTERVRITGEPAANLPAEISAYDHPVVEFGRLELLPFWREQSIAITNHRFGNPLRQDSRISSL
jgi:RHH-type proline utilization regulon transcriptional repressor/proline dehydrogenase/delta 1-pyrroline-5-carboxylate dehydrogenase